MYTPRFNRMEADADIRALVGAVGSAQVITAGPDGFPLATLLPVIWRDSTVIAHMARANRHWRHIGADEPTLLVVEGAQAYVSPRWYEEKATTGRVVPTWNYSAVQLRGTATVHTDPTWLRGVVEELTDVHEAMADEPWAVADAPPEYIDDELQGIVGIEIAVSQVWGKAKLSQNRSEADRAAVIAGLREQPGGGAEVARAMSLLD